MPTVRRVKVTSPRTTAAISVRRPVTEEIDDQTGVGDAYMRSLIRSQLRLSLTVLGALGLVVGAVPLLLHVFPSLRTMAVGAFPLPWIVLGVLVYPSLVALGWYYVRQAERTEREFGELVHLTDPP